MVCPKCGYQMDGLTRECPRCARMGGKAPAKRQAAPAGGGAAVWIVVGVLVLLGAGALFAFRDRLPFGPRPHNAVAPTAPAAPAASVPTSPSPAAAPSSAPAPAPAAGANDSKPMIPEVSDGGGGNTVLMPSRTRDKLGKMGMQTGGGKGAPAETPSEGGEGE